MQFRFGRSRRKKRAVSQMKRLHSLVLAVTVACAAGIVAGAAGFLPPRPKNYTSVLKSVYCDGQGPAERMGFDMGCAAYAIPKSYNSETNPAINCFDILDAYPMAPDAPYWFKNSVTHAVERKWCAFGGELGPRMDMG